MKTIKLPRMTRIHIINVFGGAGYVATLFIWLLVIEIIVLLLPKRVSSSIGDVTGALQTLGSPSTTQYTDTTVANPNIIVQVVLTILLLILGWIFSYFVSRVASGIMRRFFKLLHRKPTVKLITDTKYLTMAIGLVGVIILLQFLPENKMMEKLAIAFLGMIGSTLGVGSIWLQRLLVDRYRVAIGKIL